MTVSKFAFRHKKIPPYKRMCCTIRFSKNGRVEGIKKERRRLPSPFGWGYTIRMCVSLAAFRKGTCWQARFQENRRWRNDPSPPIVFRLFRFRKRRLIQPRISFSFCRLRPAESECRTEQQANQCGCCCHRSEDT